MAITKIQAGALPADVITTAAIDDASITHAKLHTTMDLSSKTVTLPSVITDTITNKLPLAGGTMTGTLNVDVADLFVKDTTGGALGQVQIGAGTVQGFINIQKGDGTRNVQLSSDGDSYLNGGNVGIGQSVPVNRLHVSGADGYAYLKLTSDSTGHTDADGSRIGLNGSDLRIINAEAASILFQTQNSERMRIDSSGVVRIGGQTGTLKLGNDGTYYADIEWEYNNNELAFTTNNVSNFTFNSNGSERLRIDSSGNVGIGTSSPNQWASYTDSAATVLQVRNTSQRARIAINGGNGAHLDLVDYAGSANDKHMNIAVDGGILKFGSLNDAGNAWVKDGIMVMDLGLGTVQLGSQPAFVATTTNSIDMTTRAIIPYNSNLYDRATNFNAANHRFTAPVTGLYTFTTYHWHKSNTGGFTYLFLFLNGSVNFEFRNTRASSHSEYNRVGFTTTLAMSANDYVHVEGAGASGGELHTSAGSAYSHFSGYLIG